MKRKHATSSPQREDSLHNVASMQPLQKRRAAGSHEWDLLSALPSLPMERVLHHLMPKRTKGTVLPPHEGEGAVEKPEDLRGQSWGARRLYKTKRPLSSDALAMRLVSKAVRGAVEEVLPLPMLTVCPRVSEWLSKQAVFSSLTP